MRENVRQRYEVGRTLDEQLAEAVSTENYELAAKLRDRMRSSQAARTRSDVAPGAGSTGLSG
jgi:protein-arginine kinase activator protein McsA